MPKLVKEKDNENVKENVTNNKVFPKLDMAVINSKMDTLFKDSQCQTHYNKFNIRRSVRNFVHKSAEFVNKIKNSKDLVNELKRNNSPAL